MDGTGFLSLSCLPSDVFTAVSVKAIFMSEVIGALCGLWHKNTGML